MEMQGQRRLPVEQALVWDALNDPAMLKLCVPGCEKFEVEGEGAYTVVTALKIGPVSARFTGKVKLSDVQPPQSYTLGFEGQGGVAGFGKGTSAVRLETVDGGCDLHYTVSATVGGKIAQLGQRLIDGVARSLADDFFKRFEAELLRRHPPPAADAVSEPATSASPPGTDGAADAVTAGSIAPDVPPMGTSNSATAEAAARDIAPAGEPAAGAQATVAPALSQSSQPDDQAAQSPAGTSSALFWIAGAVAAAVVIWLLAK